MGSEETKIHWLIYRNMCIHGIEIQGRENSNSNPDPKVFYLHGYGESVKDWLPIILSQSKGVPSFVFDFPGHGSSYRLDENPSTYLDLVDVMGRVIRRFTEDQDKVILIGHGLGGAIAQALAWEAPDKVVLLALINPYDLSKELPARDSLGQKALKKLAWPGFYERKIWKENLKKILCPIHLIDQKEELSLENFL